MAVNGMLLINYIYCVIMLIIKYINTDLHPIILILLSGYFYVIKYIIINQLEQIQQKGEQMEKVREAPESQEIFENEIDMYFKRFCTDENIEDMAAAPQSLFYAALIYVYNNTFKGTNRLKLKGKLQGYNNNNYNNQYSNINNSNCNSYNYEYLNYIADYYIYMCYKYNKICTISGYCKLTGIREDVIYNWGNESRTPQLSTSANNLYQKLSKDYESSGEARLWSGKNPVGQLAVMNRRFGWNLPGVSRESTTKTIKTAADLPQLGPSGNDQGSNVRQIAQQEIIVQDVQENPQSQ